MQNDSSLIYSIRERPLTVAITLSIVVHFMTANALNILTTRPQKIDFQPVKVRIAEPVPKEIPPPPKKKEPPKKQTAAPNQQVAPQAPVTDVPIQGVTKDSLSTEGTMAAPVGNTLMVEDSGKRLKDVEALRGDMSAPAKLIASTMVTPPYTEEALDALIQGSFIVDVYVGLDGTVREAELRKKIGYGMDVRVIDAVKGSKFIPRKNRFGVDEEGWTELKFTLVIP